MIPRGLETLAPSYSPEGESPGAQYGDVRDTMELPASAEAKGNGPNCMED
jgi:hypothetical protein